jgi:penicillin-insensitive murein endopeptidase
VTLLLRVSAFVSAVLAVSCAVPPAPVDAHAPPHRAALEADAPWRAVSEADDPIFALDDAALKKLLEQDPAALGSVSLGRPNRGAVLNAVQMPEGELWELVDPGRSWGTQETIDQLVAAIRLASERTPMAHPMHVGHISREQGGHIRPHRSHQSGRDVDLGYYYVPEHHIGWYQKANARTLDRARTWTFVRTLLTDTHVEYIFMDRSVQKLLKEYALGIGEDAEWLATVFQLGSRHPEPIIRAAWGHATHMHVRFYNPRAQSLGFRVIGLLRSGTLASRLGRPIAQCARLAWAQPFAMAERILPPPLRPPRATRTTSVAAPADR